MIVDSEHHLRPEKIVKIQKDVAQLYFFENRSVGILYSKSRIELTLYDFIWLLPRKGRQNQT